MRDWRDTTGNWFQSPRGDFGFLKMRLSLRPLPFCVYIVSIPSRGFWFFEGTARCEHHAAEAWFQSPRGDFGFLKSPRANMVGSVERNKFQSPRGDFGFLKRMRIGASGMRINAVSIPSRGFWFFEANGYRSVRSPFVRVFQSPRGDFGFLKLFALLDNLCAASDFAGFNPLAGILVF